jgi:hypothetical protein
MTDTIDRCPALTRRDLGIAALAGCIAHPAAAAVPPAGIPVGTPVGTIVCKVFRAGHDIGRATYAFVPYADTLTVSIAVDIRVRFGFLTLYRYTHTNAEQWRGDQLIGFSARTDNNGQPQFAAAHWNGSALAVTGSGTRPYVAPARAIGSSYWNKRTLTDPLINSQTGKLLNVRLASVGPGRAVLASGASVPAAEYRMSGDLRMNLWYDGAGQLAGLQYYAHDGSVITYEKT